MAKIQLTQLNGIPFKPTLFPGFTTYLNILGDTTTLEAYPSALGKPVAIQGVTSTTNPVMVFDNRVCRANYANIIMFGSAASAAKFICDITGFTQIGPDSLTAGTGLYIPTLFFSGGGVLGTNTQAALGTNARPVSAMATKTLQLANVTFFEPADNTTFLLTQVDMKGYDYLMLRFAQGSATAATNMGALIGVH